MIDHPESRSLRSQGEVERLAILQTYEVVDAKGTATLENALAIAAEVAGCKAAYMAMVESERLVHKATFGFVQPTASVKRSASFADLVLGNGGKPLVVPDAAVDPRFALQFAAHPNVRFYAGFPVIAFNTHIVGVIGCFDPEPRHMTGAQIRTIERVAENTMVSFELRRALHNARHQALTDTLTGIGNRHAFFERSERLFAETPVPPRNALLYVDLDGFKQLNDRHGHHAGDMALCIVAECIRRNIRGRDFAARIGGDEFAVLLSDCDDHETVSERIRQDVRSELRRQGWDVTASVGMLTFDKPPRSVSEALAATDALMYQAKQGGKDRVTQGAYETTAHAASRGTQLPDRRPAPRMVEGSRG